MIIIILVRCAVQAKINTCRVNGEDMLKYNVNIGLLPKNPIQSDAQKTFLQTQQSVKLKCVLLNQTVNSPK